MKKVLIAALILVGGATAVVPALSFTATAQTCDPGSPCLYTGTASTANGAIVNIVNIVVKLDERGNYVAEVAGKGTFYVFRSETEADKSHGSHYVNVNGNKYYFSM